MQKGKIKKKKIKTFKVLFIKKKLIFFIFVGKCFKNKKKILFVKIIF